VIAANARLDQAGAISITAAHERQLCVAGMGTPRLDRREQSPRPLFATGTHSRVEQLRPPMSGDRISHQRAQFVFSHDGC
jgi:hypothetical protein